MKRSDIWFQQKATQDTRVNIANISVLNKVGPNNLSEPNRNVNKNNEKYFIAGKSVIGGEEVVG